METRHTISELSQRLGVHIQTLRKYEKDFGLLIPRDEHGSRYYTDTEKDLFENIIRMKAEGLGLKAIRTALGYSVDAAEQREKAAALVPVDRLTGDDMQLIVRSALEGIIADSLAAQDDRFEKRLAAETAELKSEIDRLRDTEARLLALLEKTTAENKKPSLWGRLRGK